MQRLKQVATGTVVGLLAIAGAPVVASATPTVLPETFPINLTGTGGQTKLETVGKTRIECKTSKGEGQIVNQHEGTFTLELSECKSLVLGTLVNCHTLGDSGGTKLLKGKLVPVFESLSPLAAALLYLVSPEIHGECSIILYLARGSFIVPVTPINTKTSKFNLNLKQKEGKQEFTEYYNEKGEKVKAGLLVSFNGGAFEEVALETSEDKIEAEKEIEVMA